MAVVALVAVHVDEVLELLHLGWRPLGVVGRAQALQLALGVEAEQDGVEDVHVDQGARLVRVAVCLLRLVLWGMKVLLGIKIYLQHKEVKMISPFQTRLATYLTASR